MNFDGTFETAIVREIDVGVAAPDMGDDDGVFVAAVERLKQLMRGVAIFVGWIGDQNPRGAADRSSFRPVKDIAVPTHAGIARPFIAGQGDKTPRHVELARKIVERFPERVGDLKVVALVPDDIDEGLVAGIGEIILGRIGADGFFTLCMQVTPIVPVWRTRDDAQRRRPAKQLSALIQDLDADIAGCSRDQSLDDKSPVLTRRQGGIRQSADR